jgi:hypothetical protein
MDELFVPGSPVFARFALSTSDAAIAAAAPSTTIRTWVAAGIVQPTFQPDRRRQGAAYYWTPIDVVGLRVVHLLRGRGCETAFLMIAWQRVHDWLAQGSDADALLGWLGSEPQTLSRAELGDILAGSGGVTVVVTAPIGDWLSEAGSARRTAFDLRDARRRNPASTRKAQDAAKAFEHPAGDTLF